MNRTAGLPVLVLLSLLSLAACRVDPGGERQIPTVGTTYTGVLPGGEDVYGPQDAADDASPEDIGLSAVTPPKAGPAGGETVLLEGWGFEKGMDVYFGSQKALDVFYVSSSKLRVTTPAHTLGRYDVSALWPEGEVRTLPSAFLFFSVLEIDSVEPSEGPIAGGTPVLVRGNGFTPDSRLVVGTRLAISIDVLDEQTMVAITPPGSEGGPADVLVSNIGGTQELRDAFTYSVAPRIDSVVPAVGTVQGGNIVEIRGRWLGPADRVLFGDIESTILDNDSRTLRVIAPPGEAGRADVTVSGQWGWSRRVDGYLYVEPGDLEEGLVAVVPPTGPESGGTFVTLVSCEAAAGPEVVRFGDLSASIEEVSIEDCAILLVTPEGSGLVDVQVQNSSGVTSAKDAYTYVPEIRVDQIHPNQGDRLGGTVVTVEGRGFEPGMSVLLGPLPGVNTEVLDEQHIRFESPPGSPGVVDVTVVGPLNRGRLKGGYLYTVPSPELYAIKPVYGARAGGTFVEVLGSGFTPGTELFVGPGSCSDTKVRSYSLVEAKTPANPVGTYRVLASTNSGPAALENAYTYFDPWSDYGGTWGARVDGAVNVSVIDAYTWEGIEGATAILGSDESTEYQGLTNAMGQVVLSGRGLSGPVDLHVSKPAHDAVSIVHFDAENATVYLIPRNPTPGTGGETPETPDPGSLTGLVGGSAKYIIVPPGSCRNKIPGEDGLCMPCVTSDDCIAGTECVTIGDDGRFCTSQCVLGADDQCPSGYACAPSGDAGDFCLPERGERRIQCQVSRTSIYDTIYSLSVVQTLDSSQTYDLESRLGDVAVVCLGGWVDVDTGEFNPTTMGVKRHIAVTPGDRLENLDIQLNIPLSRELRLRLDDPPEFDAYQGTYEVSVFLDFGSDGYFKLPGGVSTYQLRDVIIDSLPQELAGDIYDARYIFYAGAYTNSLSLAPYSIVMYSDVADLDGVAVAQLQGSRFEAMTGAPQEALTAGAMDGLESATWVGEKGVLFRQTTAMVQRLPSPTQMDLWAVATVGDSDMVAVGDAGTVLWRSGGTWRLLGSVSEQDIKAVWGGADGRAVAVGPHTLVVGSGDHWQEWKVTFRLNAVAGLSPEDVWAVGDDGAMLHFDGQGWTLESSEVFEDLHSLSVTQDGQLVAAGDGCVFIYDSGTWVPLLRGLSQRFSVVEPLSDGSLLLADSGGNSYLLPAGGDLLPLESPGDLTIRDFVVWDDGTVLAIGAPATLLTPFVPFPVFDQPPPGAVMGDFQFRWHYDGDDAPITVHSMTISEYTGRTLWRLTVDGPARSFELPDFRLLMGTNPLGTVEKRLRIYSAAAQGFNINSYSFGDLSTSAWRSWAYDMITFW